nr:hypothetical protein [Helicobacter pylori]
MNQAHSRELRSLSNANAFKLKPRKKPLLGTTEKPLKVCFYGGFSGVFMVGLAVFSKR